MKREFAYLKKKNQWFPIISITLCGPKEVRTFRALVDSGASYSVFRPEVAKLLGIEIEDGKEIYLVGIGGRILGYLHMINVSVDAKNFFKCKIVFSKEHTVSLNILGRDNFFLPFLITFAERKRRVILKKD